MRRRGRRGETGVGAVSQILNNIGSACIHDNSKRLIEATEYNKT